MKVFISSLIAGMEPLRQAARAAVTTLRHQPVMAEDFGAQPLSPQIACLSGVRQSDLVVLILGAQYGTVQPSGISATHEEYRAARGHKPVLAFVQQGIHPDPRQAELIAEVQSWESGVFRDKFSGPEDLQTSIIRALHDHELTNAVGPADQDEIAARAVTALSPEERGYYSGVSAITLAVAGGPRQSILRPIEIENPVLAETLHKEAIFGQARIFDPQKGCTHRLEGGTLVLTQDSNGSRLALDEQGTIALRLVLPRPAESFAMPVLIEETVHQQLLAAIQYAAWLLDHIDSTQRLTHIAIAARIAAGDFVGWRTLKQHDASPHRMNIGGSKDAVRTPVQVSRPRAALRLEAGPLTEDIIVMLRRQFQD